MKANDATMMKTTIKALLIAGAFYIGACGPAPTGPASAQTSSNSLFASAPDQRWFLPDGLREISALAVAPNGRLFAVDDERAVIYELDADQGGLMKTFTIGAPLTGDFEGLAITSAGEFWMTTSQGALFRFREGEDGQRVEFQAFDAGLADTCEIEGLAFHAPDQSLILACKENQARDMRDTIALYAWREGAPATLWRTLPERDVANAAGVRHFRPSSLDFDARSGHLLMLSAFDGALAELSPEGVLISARALARVHNQAEGVAVLPNGALVISDEGGRARGRALLSRYPRQ
jgi:uncharacterized protein YjiK